jgi:hypothetical protein
VYFGAMELEERSIEELPEHCQNCGARLTDAERQAALEGAGGPVLCTICAAEAAAIPDEEADEGDAAY